MGDSITLPDLPDLYRRAAVDMPSADASMSSALDALERTNARHDTMAAFAAAAESVQSTQQLLDESRREAARLAFLNCEDDAKLALTSLDHELIVGSMLGDVTAILQDVLDGDVEMSDKLVDLLTKTFRDMVRFVAVVPPHIAEEVGELAAETCDFLDSLDVDSTPVSALFVAA